MVRVKQRYLLVDILYPPSASQLASGAIPDLLLKHQPTIEPLTAQLLLKSIRAETAILYGDYGSGAFGGDIQVKYLSLATSTFILRCSRAHFRLLWSVLTFMDRVPGKNGRPCVYHVVRTSGTIRKAEEEAIRQARQRILAVEEQHSKASHSAAATALPTAVSLTNASVVPEEPMFDVSDDSDDDAMDEDPS